MHSRAHFKASLFSPGQMNFSLSVLAVTRPLGSAGEWMTSKAAELLQQLLEVTAEGFGARCLRRSDGDAVDCCYLSDAFDVAGSLGVC